MMEEFSDTFIHHHIFLYIKYFEQNMCAPKSRSVVENDP